MLAKHNKMCCLLGLLSLLKNAGISEETGMLLFAVFGVLSLAIGIMLFVVKLWVFASLLTLFGAVCLGMWGFGCFVRYKEKQLQETYKNNTWL